jgi:hypothetical protein
MNKKYMAMQIKEIKLAIAKNKTIVRWDNRQEEKDMASVRIKILTKRLKELEKKLDKEKETVI